MAHQYQKRTEFPTDLGNVIIHSFCSPAQIMSLSLNETFTKYARYNPIISKKETLAEVASQPDANVTLAFTEDGKIVGFSTLEYADTGERWIRVGERTMMEVSVIEVSRLWRSTGVARELLGFLVDHPLKEERIFYMVGYSWTWDMDGKKLPPMAYRDMMIGLFAPHGFKIYQTNEPNIMLRPENLFMARIGTAVSEEIQKLFKLVRFNMDT